MQQQQQNDSMTQSITNCLYENSSRVKAIE